MALSRVRELDPATYQRHLIHGAGRIWAETNCYVDVLVELLHGLGFEPMAALPFTVRIDFEGDQWTFFKFPHADLLELFGLDIQEMNPWLSLVGHVEEQVALGRPVLVELDSYFLPDTAGTAYRLAHVKSTVAVREIDRTTRHMGYFHGQGYFHLGGEDFNDVFQVGGLVHPRMLPPYVERVRILDRPPLTERDLVERSLMSLRREIALLPRENPFVGFKRHLEAASDRLMEMSIEDFHIYSFANLRQYGACFELVETYLRWLEGRGEPGLETTAVTFREIATLAKSFQFQLARSVARKRALALEPIDQMAELWTRGTSMLEGRFC